MKILQSNKAKVIIGATLFITVFALGAMARPGIDLTKEIISGAFGSKKMAYVSKKSDNEIAIEKYLNSPEFKAEYSAMAQARVMLKISGDALEMSKVAQAKLQQLETRALNSISNATATETIAIETKQGRR